MEVHRGKGRGSYIWGRSVHNTRIERLWYDVTRGFGRKWKDFFHVLEEEAGLDPHDRGHIWLLHHLFLDAINADALAWAEAWNSHKLRQDDSPPRSPSHMFFFSQMRDGRRGITVAPTPVEEEVADPANYGIDPDTLRNPRLMAHFRDNNPDDSEDPAVVRSFPPRLSHVECHPPDCPLPSEHVELMDSAVRQRAPVRSNSLVARRHVWLEALNIYNHLVSVQST
ncbi:uncharacterized protein SCHCODRAFT_02671562 [Schizophyllum commune H4-8]|nr:uncharacterized protein SCHCODRAFT_02671562 [Schizophyllum commune H4-8]KAI5887565.1 hypothetical protein SCHCODRAFT_02671562 [Schizophyllum commune H4-8]